MTTQPLYIKLFGCGEIQRDGKALPGLHVRKAHSLLTFLIENRSRPLDRATIAGYLWDCANDPLENLRQSLKQLRQVLGPDRDRIKSPTSRSLAIDLNDSVIDLIAFDEAVTSSSTAMLKEAVALYTGPLLTDCRDLWIESSRMQRERAYLGALDRLIDEAMGNHEYELAINYCQRAIRMTPTRKRIQGYLLQALANVGDYFGVTEAYHSYCKYCRYDPGERPDPYITELYHNIRIKAQARPCVYARLPERSVTEANLPWAPVPIIARDTEIRSLVRCISQTPLVTLVGMGGIGKTRLAIEVVRTVRENYPDGTWYINLGTTPDPAMTAKHVASVLGSAEQPFDTDLESVAKRLKDKRVMLIIDSCEHVLQSAAIVCHRLLSVCPHLRILATSQEPLALSGEVVYRVSPLPVPTFQPLPSISSLADNDAVRLFVAYAKQVRHDFELTDLHAQIVGRICERLDGIPLAIELAARYLGFLSVFDILKKLDECICWLTAKSLNVEPRHRNLLAVMDWSYNVLTDAEQRLLCCLAVFVNGWTLDACEQICANNIRGTQTVYVLLGQLVHKSLIIFEEYGGQSRYRMLNTVRLYCLMKARERLDDVIICGRHFDYYYKLVHEAESALAGPDQKIWLSILEAEHSNIIAALEWSVKYESYKEKGRQLASTLWRARQDRYGLDQYVRWAIGLRKHIDAQASGIDLTDQETNYLTYAFDLADKTSSVSKAVEPVPTAEEVEKFKELYFAEYGIDLYDRDAYEAARAVLLLVYIGTTPAPGSKSSKVNSMEEKVTQAALRNATSTESNPGVFSPSE